MIKLLGFLLGSAMSVAAIVLLLGVPDLKLPDQEVADPVFVERGIMAAALVPDLPPDLPPESSPPESPLSAAPTAQPAPDSIAVPDPEIVLPVDDVHWYSFWNPFRSEIAANGFVRQLEEVTGLDYRVVKIKTGVYEVTFAYENDAERRDKLSHIASATGLELPDS
jgi:hypothetical protein